MESGAPDALPSRRTGGLKRVRDGVWRIDVELPREPGEARRRVSRTVAGTKDVAEAALDELRRDVSGAAAAADPRRRNGSPRARGRRQRGSGAIHELAHDRWLVGFEGRPDPVTGARRRHTRTIRGTRQEAEAALARLRVRFGSGGVPVGTAARDLQAACDLYLAEVRTERSTLRTDRSACNLMSVTKLPGGRLLGHVPLRDLDWKVIEQVYATWGRTLKPQTLARYASTLSKVLDYAKRTGWISTNPAKDAQRPRVPSHRPDVPTREEVKDALSFAESSGDMTLSTYALGIASVGCRRAELLAVRRRDVDLGNNVLTICAALADGGPGTGVYYKATKRADWRDVPISDQFAGALRQLLMHQDGTQVEGAEFTRDSFVFTDSPGGATWLRPDSATAQWLEARKTSTVTFAQMRRFVATELLDVTDGDYRTVASITGNSEETLRRWYDGGPNLAKKKAVLRRAQL
jgi:integrase